MAQNNIWIILIVVLVAIWLCWDEVKDSIKRIDVTRCTSRGDEGYGVCPHGERLACNNKSCKCVKWDCYENDCLDGEVPPCKKGYKSVGNAPGERCYPSCPWAGKYGSGCKCCK